MSLLAFLGGFAVLHTVSYTLAGVLALSISSALYRGPDRHMDFLRDASDPSEAKRLQRWAVPLQLPRGIVLALVLTPILEPLRSTGFWPQFLFLFGLMFVVADLASSAPFPGNLEGFIYLRDKYLKRGVYWKLHFESALYSLMLAA
ncbi:MAG: hypothetical protein U1E29_00590, partial [Coriobacteriia bacterium]|nr:hypothetical protein [Coriobacteriia bacterium]